MMTELENLYKEFNGKVSQSLTKLLDIMDDSAVAAELHGFFRLWMHLTVDEEGGCRQMRARARGHKLKNGKTLRLVKGAFIRLFVSPLLCRHGGRPHCYLYDDVPVSDAFRKLVEEKPTHFQEGDLENPLYVWPYLHFKKGLTFDYFIDYTELLEDKAISVEKYFFDNSYNRNPLRYAPPRSSHSRRLMEEILQMTTLEVEKICELIMQGKVIEE